MSWGENALALKKALGARVHALPNHMHPHAAMLLYQNAAGNLDQKKHIEGSDLALAAYARAVGLKVVRDDGEVLYWRTTRRGHFSEVSLTCGEAAVVARKPKISKSTLRAHGQRAACPTQRVPAQVGLSWTRTSAANRVMR